MFGTLYKRRTRSFISHFKRKKNIEHVICFRKTFSSNILVVKLLLFFFVHFFFYPKWIQVRHAKNASFTSLMCYKLQWETKILYFNKSNRNFRNWNISHRFFGPLDGYCSDYFGCKTFSLLWNVSCIWIDSAAVTKNVDFSHFTFEKEFSVFFFVVTLAINHCTIDSWQC